MMEIDEKMPENISDIFKDGIFNKKFLQIQRITKFRENQCNLFVKHAEATSAEYKAKKEEIKRLNNLIQKFKEGIRKEQAITRKLREAYKSGLIVPSLFQLKSPKILSLNEAV